MSGAWFTVFKKEMARFFGDKRLLFSTVILPGLMIYLMYSVMGMAMSSMLDTEESVYKVAVANMPSAYEAFLPEESFEIEQISPESLEECKKELSDKTLDLCVIFPENFEASVTSFNTNDTDREIPNIELYYNSTSVESSSAYDSFEAIFNAFETKISNVFDINYVESVEDFQKYDVATDAETTGTLFASILPVLLIVFMFSACMSLAPESIAGEKERGTIATLLITPIPRNQIVIGKICSLACIALLSGISSFLGTFLSMPAMLGSMSDEMSTQYYTASDYVCLVLLILSTVLLFVTAISILSALAKTVKEATTLVMPLMIVVMVISFASMYSTSAKSEFFWYFIPVYNTVQGMVGIFSFTSSPVNLTISVVSNVLFSLLGVFVLAKMFNNEDIIFGK